MKIERGYRSRDVEDARGEAPPRFSGGGGRALKIGGGGGALLVVLALIAQAMGVDLGLGGSSSSSSSGTGAGRQSVPGTSGRAQGSGAPVGLPPGAADPESDAVDLVNEVTDDVQAVFGREFAQAGKSYRRAKVRLFRDAVDTGCGVSSSQVGPFYCPPDEKAYIDLSFYDDLRAKFGAPGDFAQAYVIAHELGHHVQNLLGIDEEVQRRVAGDKRLASDQSVRQELQADCFAGVWAAHADPKLAIDPDDIEEAMRAAASIGDDRLQKMAGRAVDPRSFTHGSSAQRVKWFKAGYQGGSLDSCDTFSPATP
ncbi:MAG TPA: neutral zinc metallopeptidase [Kofleriaceae bacterium]|nr:neutral zinc metallopeptidase [Kofleriaceae bacterium]